MLLEVIQTFFVEFIGYTPSVEPLYLMAFALVCWLVGCLVGIFSKETRKMWNWGAKLCLIVYAIYICASLVLPLVPEGGVFACGSFF